MQEENYLTQLKKMHRRERDEREVDMSFKLFYFGREEELYSYFPQAEHTVIFDEERDRDDLQRTALRMALKDFKSINPVGYAYIAEFYLGEQISAAEMGRRHKVSRQAISQRISNYIAQLRTIVFEYMKILGA